MDNYNLDKKPRFLKSRKAKFFLAFLLVFLVGKFIDFSFNFSAGKLYNPSTYELDIKISSYKRIDKKSRVLASANKKGDKK